MARLTNAQRRKLEIVPQEWGIVPIHGDARPIAPLLRSGLVEERQIDVTPPDWEPSPIRWIRHEWRITEAGRAALSSKESELE
jgi:hypothetical protein